MGAPYSFQCSDVDYCMFFHYDWMAEAALWLLPELSFDEFQKLADLTYFNNVFQPSQVLPSGFEFSLLNAPLLNAYYRALVRAFKNYMRKMSPHENSSCIQLSRLIWGVEKERRLEAIDAELPALRELLFSSPEVVRDNSQRRLEAQKNPKFGVYIDGEPGFRELPGHYVESGIGAWKLPHVQAFFGILYLAKAVAEVDSTFNPKIYETYEEDDRRIDLRGLSPDVINAFIANVNKTYQLAKETVLSPDIYKGYRVEYVQEVHGVWQNWVTLLNSCAPQPAADK